MKIKSINII